MLRNPCYAGALVYGRTGSRTVVGGQRPSQAGRGKRPMEEWKVLLREHHEGYISWEQYLHHQLCWRPTCAASVAKVCRKSRMLDRRFGLSSASGPQSTCAGISPIRAPSMVAL